MSLLSHNQIADLLEDGIIENADYDCINSASLDIHIGRIILVEKLHENTRLTGMSRVLSLKQKDALTVDQYDLEKHGHFILRPGQFILAHSQEIFNLPADISAEYKLNSSMARIGLEHLNAGWCDAGWNGSCLTLELRNLTTYHEIEICYGDRIGQMVFFKHLPVPADRSYAVRGRYNGDTEVSGVKPDIAAPGNEIV